MHRGSRQTRRIATTVTARVVATLFGNSLSKRRMAPFFHRYVQAFPLALALSAANGAAAQQIVEPERATRTHDGFYLRLGAGFAYTNHAFDGTALDFSATARGLAIANELSLGGTVARGLVFGAGFFSHVTPAPKSGDLDFRDRTGKVTLDPSYFSVFGVFADYYFDPRGGLHVQGALGLSTLRSGRSEHAGRTVTGEQDATGVGATLGVGHEWWIHDEWSLGVLFRLAYGALKFDDRGNEWSHSLIAPALLLSATYH